jgi:hypothetical protein
MSTTVINTATACGNLFEIGHVVTINGIPMTVMEARIWTPPPPSSMRAWYWEHDQLTDRYHLRVVGFPA